MSAWRTAIRALHSRGGVATASQVADDLCDETSAVSKALQQARDKGLVLFTGRRGDHTQPWQITPAGLAWAEGRIEQRLMPPRPGAKRAMRTFCATWLSSLPTDIRIEQKEPA